MPDTTPSTINDSIPSPARAVSRTHPNWLASVAILFGLEPASIEQCRVLEIGCAGGGNLIPMAEELAGSSFLGLDRSERAIERGQALSRAAGLMNIELRCGDWREFPKSAGTFDYIIAHGVYSRTAPGDREKLLDLCGNHLSPQGVAYISYNTQPGWHGLEILRDRMLAHSAGGAMPGERVRLAREALDFIVDFAPTDRLAPGGPLGGALTGAWAAQIKAMADSVRSLPEADLLHDYLGEYADAVSFRDFIAAARSRGMQYLGDAQVETMSTAALGAGIDAALRKVAGDWLEAEQLLDVLRNRAFRQTLLVRAEAPIRRPIDPLRVQRLYAGSAAEPGPDQGGDAETFHHPSGSHVSASDPLVRAAIKALAEVWPARLAFADLLASTWRLMGLGPTYSDPESADMSSVEKKLAGLLLQGFFTGMVELSVRPATWATALPDRPQARRLARIQVQSDDTVTTLRHQNLKLNRMARQLLQLLDGTRDSARLLDDLEKLIRDSAKAIGGTAILTPDDRARLAKGLDHDLRRFVAEGLLLA